MHSCVHVHGNPNKTITTSPMCFWFLVIRGFLEEEYSAVSRGVRFRTQYYRLARKARLNLPSANFYAIHLRVEQEALQIFGKGAFVLNGSALDACLVSTHGWNWSAPNSTLYVSAGPSVFAYPEVQHWLNATRFRHVVHLGTLLKNSAISHLGREEWGIVEALVCVHARSYAAFFGLQPQYVRAVAPPPPAQKEERHQQRFVVLLGSLLGCPFRFRRCGYATPH